MSPRPAADSPRDGQEREALRATVAKLERELQIEAALERVRARAMAMHASSEMLEVADVMFQQLRGLEDGLEANLWGCGVVICRADSDDDEVWFANQYGVLPAITVPHTEDPTHREMYAGWKSKSGLYSEFKEGAELKAHYDYMLSVPDVRPIFEEILASGLSFPTWQKWHAAYFSHGYLLIITTVPYENEQIFTRFARVFDQAYTRFLDLQKAEAQAREARIEAALERVRAASMAMHQSEELNEVLKTMFQELIHLDFKLARCVIWIYKEEDRTVRWYAANPEAEIESYLLPYTDYKVMKDYWEFWEKRVPRLYYDLSGDLKKGMDAYVFNHTEMSRMPEAVKKGMTAPEQIHIYNTFQDFGCLFVSSEELLGEEILDILERFGRAFNQSYTRFLDLQKAEAQAREARIEASLERVRARTMAMRHSAELGDVAAVLFSEMNELVTNLWTCGFVLCEKDRDEDEWWLGMDDGFTRGFYLPNTGDFTHATLYEGWKEGDDFRTVQLEGDALQEHYDWLMDNPTARRIFEDMEVAGLQKPAWQKLHAAYFSKGYLCIITEMPCSEEEIFKRFAQVFDLTYTRFLDLKKAEGQAREAQIEAALERVRAASMAMHDSSELQTVVNTLFEQLKTLHIPLNSASIFILEEGRKDWQQWVATDSTSYSTFFHLPYGQFRVQRDFQQAREQGLDFYTAHYNRRQKNSWFEHAFAHTEYRRVPKERQQYMLDSDRLIFSVALQPHIALQLAKYEGGPFTEDENTTLERFAKVFEQAYTRFLDLQRAEAQAREAEIQLALERVRSRSMAMKSSEELSDVLSVLFAQFDILGIKPVFAHLTLFDEENDTFSFRMTGQSGQRILVEQIIDINQVEAWKASYRQWKEGDENEANCIDYPPEALPQIWEIMAEIFEALPEESKMHIEDFPNGIYTTQGHCKFGYLGFNHTRRATDEEKAIVVRFATEFGRLYQRYLELKTAEAQAREAQIQAALERVRAASMAMHHSDDIGRVLSVFYTQLQAIEINPVNTYVVHYNTQAETFTLRITDKAGNSVTAEQELGLDVFPEWRESYEHWKSSEEYGVFVFHYTQNELPLLFNSTDQVISAIEPENKFIPEDYPDGWWCIQGHTPYGWFGVDLDRPPSEEELAITPRFSREFGRTFQRFLDLQKAEAQAREAQIEAALERVRSRSLAMHATSEMQEVANEVYEQLKYLGVEMDAVGMSGVIEAKKDYDVWVGGASMGKALRIPYNEKTEVQRDYNKAIKERSELFARTYSGKIKEEYIKHLLSHGEFPKDLRNKMVKSTAFSTSITFSKYSGIQIARYTNQPYSEEVNDLLKRFAKVFEQAYIRFRDLEKAETQAREAQIEASLERVRARAMGMQKSDELSDVLAVLFQQFDVLGIHPVNVWLSLYNTEDRTFTYRATGTSGKRIHKHQVIDLDAMDIWKESVEQWEKGTAEAVIVTHYPPEVFPQLMEVFAETFSAMPQEERIKAEDFPEGGYNVQGYCKFGYIGFNHKREPTEEEKEILKKFATEFDRLYQRFIDIDKAEAQAREARIETALEVVRSRSLAMHTADELQNVVRVVAEKLQELGVVVDPVGVIICTYPSGDYREVLHWTYTADEERSTCYSMPYFEHPIWDETVASISAGEESFAKVYPKKIKNKFLRTIYNHPDSDYRDLPEEFKQWQLSSDLYALNFAWGKNSALLVPNNDGLLLPEESMNILVRFARVFEQAYIRFMDLQKSEAQARESQIQLALERVRAKSMAMQSSDELHEVLSVLFQQFDNLGINPVNVFLSLFDRKARTLTYRASGKSGTRIPGKQVVKVDSMEPLKALFDKWIHDTSDSVEVIFYPREVLPELFGIFNETFASMPEEDRMGPGDFPEGGYSMAGYTPFGYLGYDHQRQASEEEKDILSRFCKEFTRVYQRFLDIEKAEVQAREAEIQLALERVRAATMAMHTSQELSEVAAVLFRQMRELGVTPERLNIGIVQEQDAIIEYWSTEQGGKQIDRLFKAAIDEPTTISRLYAGWKAAQPIIELHQTGKELTQWLRHLKEVLGMPFDENLRQERRVQTAANFKHGMLLVSTPDPVSEESKTLLHRFAGVFEQTYTRFLDLQKAEASAREAQIEAALERVRARSMAMQSSEELSDVLSALFQQFDLLGISPKTAWLTLWNPLENTFTYRSTGTSGLRIQGQQVIDIDGMEIWRDLYNKWKTGTSDSVEVLFYSKEDLGQLFSLLEETYLAMPEEERLTPEHFPDGGYSVQGHCKFGYIGYTHTREPSKEDQEILTRFATEFGRTYQRFLDIEKAEAQARETEIQLALERVRAATMAMHQASELEAAASVLYKELRALGVDQMVQCGYCIVNTAENTQHMWLSGMDGKPMTHFVLPIKGDSLVEERHKAWKSKIPITYQKVAKKKFEKHLETVRPDLTPDQREMSAHMPDPIHFYCGNFRDGYLHIVGNKALSSEQESILKRFTQAFEITYTRFLDLKKAEEQAREARIEAALERVRARTMAMHNTEDIGATVITFFEELVGLGLGDSMRIGIGILSQSEQMKFWTATINETSQTILQTGFLDMSKHPLLVGAKNAWAQGVSHYNHRLEGEDVKTYFQTLNDAPEVPAEFDLNKLPPTIHHQSYVFGDGILYSFTDAAIPEDISNIMERFAAVFGQTYTRYLDLQKAEHRAREAQIEAALERVRARTMAMHNTDDIADTVTTFFNELLGLNPDASLRCGVGILSQSEHMQLWTASGRNASQTVLHAGILDMSVHPLLKAAKANWASQGPPFTYALKGNDQKRYFQAMDEAPDYPARFDLDALPKVVYHNSFVFRDGILFAFTDTPLADDIRSILERFAAVFGQTYTRYLDLQKAEKRAREALRQASIERVRGEIASMRSTADLERITPLIWNELTALGVPFIRCGVFIIQEQTQTIQTYLSAPDGHALGVMNLDFEAGETTRETVAHWRRKEAYQPRWTAEEFTAWTESLLEDGKIQDRKTYQDTERPPEMLYLNFIPFAQGMLYVGNTAPLEEDALELIRSLAEAFAFAYARYEDFNQLEKTLSELKATQAQLIQSEKMASLGELTAGIAHEIQNPLNFVNNFSEVSAELLEELLEELQKGEWEEVKALAEDVTQNLQKIVHHGKRADGIVKGMLQHSRSSDGKKEPTDLNALADEYLRLAYHGLRAKDKTFNATLETHFDPGVGRVELVPQDIGRVILNLLTNAFHAVSEKAREGQGGYEPTVAIATARKDGRVVLTVTDNGNGIPEKVREKIFQPFFTTKPTGQGTGLGLSMSYDIVRAHGGELEVQTREGSGTTFFLKFKPGT